MILEKLKNIKTVSYDLKSIADPMTMDAEKIEKIEKSRKDKIGFLAKNLHEIFPELVNYQEENEKYHKRWCYFYKTV